MSDPEINAVNSINLQSAGSLPKIGRSVETLINEQRLKLLTPAGAFQLLKPRRRVLSSTRVISRSHGNNKPYLLHKLVGFFFKLGICVKSASFYPTDNGLPSLWGTVEFWRPTCLNFAESFRRHSLNYRTFVRCTISRLTLWFPQSQSSCMWIHRCGCNDKFNNNRPKMQGRWRLPAVLVYIECVWPAEQLCFKKIQLPSRFWFFFFMLSHNIFYSVPFVFCIISMETGFGLPFYLQHKQNTEIQMHFFQPAAALQRHNAPAERRCYNKCKTLISLNSNLICSLLTAAAVDIFNWNCCHTLHSHRSSFFLKKAQLFIFDIWHTPSAVCSNKQQIRPRHTSPSLLKKIPSSTPNLPAQVSSGLSLLLSTLMHLLTGSETCWGGTLMQADVKPGL